jgi:hypothetical protein
MLSMSNGALLHFRAALITTNATIGIGCILGYYNSLCSPNVGHAVCYAGKPSANANGYHIGHLKLA